MLPTSPTLLHYLRRHRRGWALLMAALVLKLAASTICAWDAPPSGWQAADTRVALVDAAHPDAADDAGCLLGEGSSCHCACAHAVALPTALPSLDAAENVTVVLTHVPAAATPRIARSPLRPPIA
jgi:hypothetical protein